MLNNEIFIFAKKYLSMKDNNFTKDLKNIPFFTYRTNFEKIYPTDLTNDVGWGCMIRSGQMLMAYCLVKNSENKNFLSILEKFNNNVKNTYSIHNIVTVASFMGVSIGSWFSPTITSLSFELINNEEDNNSNLTVKVFQDGIIEKDKLKQLISNNKILVLLPIMLGLTEISNKYMQVLLKLFEFELFSGIVGGKPKSSMYFIGKNKNKLLCLNPHTVKPHKDEIILEDYICKNIEILPIEELDPSMILSFLLNNEDDIDKMENYINDNFTKVEFPICFGSKKNIENIEILKKENDWEFITQ